MAVLVPELLWAQRKDKLYVTIDLQDCPEPTVNVTTTDGVSKIEFKGTASGHDYELTIELMEEIQSEEATIACTPRHIFMMLPKKEEGDHWPRLTKEKVKNSHIKVDWSKYLDQDDEESGADGFNADSMGDMNPMAGMGGMGGMGAMAGMGGAGGMGGMDMAKLQEMMAAQGGGMGGMGDMGGDEEGEEDSDDDDLPDLEG